jgi:beta-phosphoglucomutase-like phosphatase (HAD superfamily)
VFKAAKAAGMKCIAVPEVPHDEEAFNSARPDRIVKSLEIIGWEDL